MKWFLAWEEGTGDDGDHACGFSEFESEADARSAYADLREQFPHSDCHLYLIRGVMDTSRDVVNAVGFDGPCTVHDTRGVYPREVSGVWHVFSDHPRRSGWLIGDSFVGSSIKEAAMFPTREDAEKVAAALRLQRPWNGTVDAPVFVPYARVEQPGPGLPFVIRLFSDVVSGYLSEVGTDLSLTPPKVCIVNVVDGAARYPRQEDARDAVRILHLNRAAWNREA